MVEAYSVLSCARQTAHRLVTVDDVVAMSCRMQLLH